MAATVAPKIKNFLMVSLLGQPSRLLNRENVKRSLLVQMTGSIAAAPRY
jgi:hypothetical protein